MRGNIFFAFILVTEQRFSESIFLDSVFFILRSLRNHFMWKVLAFHFVIDALDPFQLIFLFFNRFHQLYLLYFLNHLNSLLNFLFFLWLRLWPLVETLTNQNEHHTRYHKKVSDKRNRMWHVLDSRPFKQYSSDNWIQSHGQCWNDWIRKKFWNQDRWHEHTETQDNRHVHETGKMCLSENTEPSPKWIVVECHPIEKVSRQNHVNAYKEVSQKHWQIRRVMAFHICGVSRYFWLSIRHP